MKEKQWYERLIENYARNYDQEIFTKGTEGLLVLPPIFHYFKRFV